MKYISKVLTIISLLFCSACALENSFAATATVPPTTPSQTIQPPTPTEITPTPLPTLTPTPIPTETPIMADSMDAKVMVNSLILRSGPGTTFPVVSKYTEGSTVTLIAREPGDRWVKAETEDNRVGWMLAQMLETQGNIEDLVIADLRRFMTIKGRVIDTTGEPVDKINVAVFQDSDQGEKRTDAESTNDGYFYAYLPPDSAGIWSLSVVGVNCKSRIMDSECQFVGSFDPMIVQLPGLPPAEPVTITYRP